jgi:hypothetical protein
MIEKHKDTKKRIDTGARLVYYLRKRFTGNVIVTANTTGGSHDAYRKEAGGLGRLVIGSHSSPRLRAG